MARIIQCCQAEGLVVSLMLTTGLNVGLAQGIIAADHCGTGGFCYWWLGRGADIHHATGSIAVQQTAGASKYGELFHREEINAVQLRLTVWQCLREPIHVHPQSAYPERRASTEAPG